MTSRPRIGVVVIGKNEGPRLARSLRSVRFLADACVYVDSASTDTSASVARRLGVHVVELDSSRAINAARARNVGLAKLRQLDPGIRYVQFVDGDCQVVRGWLRRAARELSEHPDVGAVCGETRELDADSTVFKRLVDMEFELPSGDIERCHGNAMYRLEAVERAGGFNDGLVAGEEAGLCRRVRAQGFRIRKLDMDMVYHDIGTGQLRTWWRRAVRNGYAHLSRPFDGGASVLAGLKSVASTLFWVLGIPAVILATLAVSQGWSLLGLGVYPLQLARMTRHKTQTGRPMGDGLIYGTFTMLQKVGELVGVAAFAVVAVRRTPQGNHAGTDL